MDHMRISGTEPSSVIISKKNVFTSWKEMSQSCQNKLNPKGWCNEPKQTREFLQTLNIDSDTCNWTQMTMPPWPWNGSVSMYILPSNETCHRTMYLCLTWTLSQDKMNLWFKYIYVYQNEFKILENIFIKTRNIC